MTQNKVNSVLKYFQKKPPLQVANVVSAEVNQAEVSHSRTETSQQAVQVDQVSKFGRPPGTSNKVGHGAGGSRQNSGRPVGSKNKSQLPLQAGYKLPENRGGKRNGAGRKRKADDVVSPSEDPQANFDSKKQSILEECINHQEADLEQVPVSNKSLGCVTDQDNDATTPFEAQASISPAFKYKAGNLVEDHANRLLIQDLRVPLGFDGAWDSDDGELLIDELDNEPNVSAPYDELNEPDDILEGAVQVYLESIMLKLKSGSTDIMNQLQQGQLWIHPQDASVQMVLHCQKGKGVSPHYHYLPRVFIYVPHLTWKHLAVPCGRCGNTVGNSSKGWNDKFRRVIDLDSCYYILTCRYQCSQCKNHFVPTSEEVRSKLPFEVQLQFPAVLSKKSALDLKVMRLMAPLVENSFGPTQLARMLLELHTSKHTRDSLAYYSTALTLMKSNQMAIGQIRITDSVNQVPRFSTFANSKGYCGKVPSSQYLMSMFVKSERSQRDYYDLCVQRREATIYKTDASFKITKHLSQENGVKFFEGLQTVLNEYGEIVSQHFIPSTAHSYLAMPIKAKIHSLEVNSLPQIRLVYTDNCCGDRSLYERLIPSLRYGQANKALYTMEMEDIVYTNNSQSCLILCDELMSKITQHDYSAIGLDCEWEFSQIAGSGGKIGKVALLQLALKDKVYLFHLSSMQYVPVSLMALLNSTPLVPKVGRNISADCNHLLNDYGIDVVNIVDIGGLARDKGIVGRANESLRTLCNKVLHFDLDKSDDSPRNSKWSRKILTEAQKLYAAVDAQVSLKVYEQLNMPVPYVQNEQPMSSPESLSPTSDVLRHNEHDHVNTRVKNDLFHSFQRIQVPRHHPYQFEFCLSLSDCVYVENVDDVAAVTKVLTEKRLSYDDIKRSKRDYILKRVRRRVPQPEVLVEKLTAFVAEFGQAKYKDAKSGKVLLDEDAKKEIASMIVHASRGCLSDPDDISLYYKTGIDKDGLTTYRCIRGTSDVEGSVHQKIEMKFEPFNAGPEYADTFLALYRHRHNIRASERHRINFPRIGHYSHHLIDHIQAISNELFGMPVFDWWSDQSQCLKTDEAFGVIPVVPFAEQTQNLSFNDKRLSSFTNSIRFLSVKMKTVIPHLPVQTVEEMSLFKQSILKFLPSTGKQFLIDFTEMAKQWNAGQLGLLPDGRTIRCKLPQHLQSHFKTYMRAVARKNSLAITATSLRHLQQDLANFETNFVFPQLAAAGSYGMTSLGILNEERFDCDSDISSSDSKDSDDSINDISKCAQQVGYVAMSSLPSTNVSYEAIHKTVMADSQHKDKRSDPKCKNCNLKRSQGCNGGTRAQCVLKGGKAPRIED